MFMGLRGATRRTSSDHNKLFSPVRTSRAEEQTALVAIQAGVPLEEPCKKDR